MIFGNLFGKKQQTGAASPAPVAASPRPKGAFGRFFGEYNDGSTFFDRALAAAAIAEGDYGAGATIRRDASERARLRKAEQDKKRREALYASPFANLYANQTGMASQQQGEAMPRAGMTPNPSALSLDPIEPQAPVISQATGLPIEPDVNVVQGTVRRPAPPAPDPNSMAARFEQAEQLALQNGDMDKAKEFRETAKGLREQSQTAKTMQYQQAAALLAPALNLEGQNQVDQINITLDRVAQSLGVKLPQDFEDLLLDPQVSTQQKVGALNSLVNFASPQKAAETQMGTTAEIIKQRAEQQFGPVQEIRLGNRVKLVNGAGVVVAEYDIGISAETIYEQTQQNRRNTADNATSRENSIRSANRPLFDDSLFGDTSNQGQAGQVGPWTAYQTPKRQKR